MATKKRFKMPPKERIDHEALFIAAAKNLVRSAGLLDAYRKSSGLCIRQIKTQAAVDGLAEAARLSSFKCSGTDRDSLPSAMQHAGMQAICAYTGAWWTCSLVSSAPADLADGDEYFSRETVCAVIELRRDPVPDRPA